VLLPKLTFSNFSQPANINIISFNFGVSKSDKSIDVNEIQFWKVA